MTLPVGRVARTIAGIHARTDPTNPANAKEAATAQGTLVKLLAKHGLTWNDLPAHPRRCHQGRRRCRKGARKREYEEKVRAARAEGRPEINVLNLADEVVRKLYVAMTPEDRLIVSLWILHCYVFDRFEIQPQTPALSPPIPIAERRR